jgi:hypothetical protein
LSAYLAISISSSAVFFFGFQYINGFRGVPVGGAIYRKGRHGRCNHQVIQGGPLGAAGPEEAN